jgi:L-threonylcarbamoyladenylate synthase
MKIVDYNFFKSNLDFYISEALKWKTFIYPTDTIYGIWWITNTDIVKKIYQIKNRDYSKPFSIIAPNINWIIQNFEVKNDFKNYLNTKLQEFHGITIILKRRDQKNLTNIWTEKWVWVRILNHPFQDFINKLWQPFITTSANLSWENWTWIFENINPILINQTDYIINWWNLIWKPSIIIDYENNKILRA